MEAQTNTYFTKESSFDSFNDAQSAIERYQKATNALFVKVRSKKFLGANVHEETKNRILFSSVHFECKHGNMRKSLSTGARPNQRSVKFGCQAYIKLCSRKIAGVWRIAVKDYCLQHSNHAPSVEAVSVLPKNRRTQVTDVVKTLANCQSERVRDLREVIKHSQGIHVLPQDIYNLKCNFKKSTLEKTDQESVNSFLLQLHDEGGRTDYGKNGDNTFVYLSYQTRDMVWLLNKYPEILIMDITYKTNKYLLPLLTVMCVDKEGKGHPVFHSFISCETQDVICKCLHLFKNSYDSQQTTCFFVDKDIPEIASINCIFDNAKVLLCAFHIKTVIEKALSKKSLLPKMAEKIAELFFLMKETQCIKTFNELKSNIESIAPQEVIVYFEKNWWNKPELWASHLHQDTFRLNVTTTNHCESYHSKIKKQLHHQMSLFNAILNLAKYDALLFCTRFYFSLINANSRHCNVQMADPVIDVINSDLTSFAARHVVEQYLASKKTDYSIHPSTDDAFILESSKGSAFKVSYNDCECSFNRNFSLPCRHMFFLKNIHGKSLFEVLSPRHRFKKSVDNEFFPVHPALTNTIMPTRKLCSAEDKYLAANTLTKKIASYLSLLGMEDFKQKYEELETLFNLWQRVDGDQKIHSGGACVSDPLLHFEERNTVTSDTINESIAEEQEADKVQLIKRLEDTVISPSLSSEVVNTVAPPESSSSSPAVELILCSLCTFKR